MAKTMAARGMRAATSAVLLVGGGAIDAAATGSADDLASQRRDRVLVRRVRGSAWTLVRRQGDVAAIMRVGGDERQRSLARDATTIAGYTMVFATIAGAVVEIARGQGPGAYGVMCVVGGVTYVVALFVLQRRR